MSVGFNLEKIPNRKPGVRYRRHPVYPYVVGDDGNIFSIKHPRFRGEKEARDREMYLPIKFMPDKDGYCMMSLRKDGVFRRGRAHVMVLETFVGPRPPGAWALHANDVRSDNRLSNLRWDIPKANYVDRRKNGVSYVGICNPAAKLTEAQVREIRSAKSYRGYISKLTRKYGISKALISKIRARDVWSHLP